MAKTQHTKITNPSETGIGSGVRTEDGCLVKSTRGSSTWGTYVDHDEATMCVAGNLIYADNIDPVVTGVYNRTNLLARFLGDWDEVLDVDKSPYYDTSGDFPVFSYSKNASRLLLPTFYTTKPHGFYYQAVIKFKEPINIPPKADIKWYFTPEVQNGSHGGMKGKPGEELYHAWDSVKGGIYSVDSLNDISTDTVTWKNNTCGGNKYWKEDGIENNPSYVAEHGKHGVTMLVSRMLYGGCAGWDKTKFNATLVACTVLATQLPLVEGTDF